MDQPAFADLEYQNKKRRKTVPKGRSYPKTGSSPVVQRFPKAKVKLA